MNRKPLNRKAYGSIPHLPNSRMGPADHHCHVGQARIATGKARDWRDVVIVTEKLDGSCCSFAKIKGSIFPLTRAGYVANTSPYEQHSMFYEWGKKNYERVAELLGEGERCVGEWMIQAHGTRYALPHEPFVVFDIIRDECRIPYHELVGRCCRLDFVTPKLISYGPPISVEQVLKRIKVSGHGALDEVEGAVWRVERNGCFDFIVKYVRPDKEDGVYLPSVTGVGPVWNGFAFKPSDQVLRGGGAMK